MPPPAETAALPIPPPAVALPGERRVLEAAERSLQGERRGLRAAWPFLGPAFIAAVAYVDPGNFATNLAGGAKFGYMLLWVILAANLMAMLIQTMSAKLGIATGMNLPEVCRAKFPRPVTVGLWLQAEVIAMATDLAEFIGAALGLNLLFGMPLVWAGLAHGRVRLRHPGAADARRLPPPRGGDRRPRRPDRGRVRVRGRERRRVAARRSRPGSLIPRFSGSESVLLAAGILGATVMPHVIYLHSALTQRRVVGRDARGAAAHLPLRAGRRDHRDDDRRRRQHGHADHRRGGLPRQRLRRRRRASSAPRTCSGRSSAATPRRCSASRCSRRGSRRRRSARSPARS